MRAKAQERKSAKAQERKSTRAQERKSARAQERKSNTYKIVDKSIYQKNIKI